MYRTRRRSSSPGCLIFLGIFAGLAFLVYNTLQRRADHSSPSSPTGVIEVVSSGSDPDAIPTATPYIVAQADIVNTSLFIPKAGIYAPIIRVYLDGTSWDISQLGMNVGHLQGTAWLDSGPGNIVLSAHVEMSDGRAGVFANIDDLEVGDMVIIESPGETRYYSVTRRGKVEPDDLTPIYPTTFEEVTLITCGSYNFFRDSYLERIVVVAERVS